MSKLIVSSFLHKGSRPASASSVSETGINTKQSTKDTNKRKRRSSSMDNTTTTVRSALCTPSGLSSSLLVLDVESRLEDSLSQSAKEFSSPSSSVEPPSRYSKNKNKNENESTKKEEHVELDDYRSTLTLGPSSFAGLHSAFPSAHLQNKSAKKEHHISTPEFKLKPRPQRKSSASIRLGIDGYRSTLRSSSSSSPSFSSGKTALPKIFIPFLPTLPTLSTSSYSQAEKQPQPKPLSPPPLLPKTPVQLPSTPDSVDGSKVLGSIVDPKHSKRIMPVSKPLSSPPQLIPSFDFGIFPPTRDIITSPPMTKRAPAPFATPLSIMTAQTQLSMDSVETHHKNCGVRVVGLAAVMAKPIARRPPTTPSNRNGSSSSSVNSYQSTASYSWDHDFTPRRVFQNSDRNHNKIGAASSQECSAFSFSSTTPSLMFSPIIQRAWSQDDND